jgi:hypothetical protein
MNELTLHPNVYSTGASKGLIQLLERVWVRENMPGDGHMYVISGFANYNGGVRFYDVFKNHISNGGIVTAIFGGSTSTKLSSKQVVTAMLENGVDVIIVNRKRQLHAKCYGCDNSRGQSVIVTSGNFTGPGMSQNVEMSLLLDHSTTDNMNFSWNNLIQNILNQKWVFYRPNLNNLSAPAWSLLYDEQASDIRLDETEEVTMFLILSHADTARINSSPGKNAGKGSQYFWLSKDCYDFFPPLTIRNVKGDKATYSCLINMNYINLGLVVDDCRVTFEAENNLDFRLGTGPFRYTNIAKEGDLAAITRVGEKDYELRIYKQDDSLFTSLAPYAVNYIGHQGKRYGFMSNREFGEIIGIRF